MEKINNFFKNQTFIVIAIILSLSVGMFIHAIKRLEPYKIVVVSDVTTDVTLNSQQERDGLTPNLAKLTVQLPEKFINFYVEFNYKFKEHTGEKLCFVWSVEGENPDRRNVQCEYMQNNEITYSIPLSAIKSTNLTKIHTILTSSMFTQKTIAEIFYK